MDSHSNPLFAGPAAGMSDGSVSALVALIVSASKNIEAEYAKSSTPSVPSLDDLTTHPLDLQISSPALRQATRILEGACAQLCATVARPQHTIIHVSSPVKLPWADTYSGSSQRLMQVNSDTGCSPGMLLNLARGCRFTIPAACA